MEKKLPIKASTILREKRRLSVFRELNDPNHLGLDEIGETITKLITRDGSMIRILIETSNPHGTLVLEEPGGRRWTFVESSQREGRWK